MAITTAAITDPTMIHSVFALTVHGIASVSDTTPRLHDWLQGHTEASLHFAGARKRARLGLARSLTRVPIIRRVISREGRVAAPVASCRLCCAVVGGSTWPNSLFNAFGPDALKG